LFTSSQALDRQASSLQPDRVVDGNALEEAESLGRRAAQRSIAAQHPRWCVLGTEWDAEAETLIDLATGLPLQVVHVPADLEERERRFIRAYNAEIRRAKLAGQIRIDFRRLLTTRAEIEARLLSGPSHVLAAKRPLDLLGVRYEVFVPQPPKKPPRFRPIAKPYIRRVDEDGRHFVMACDGSPVPALVGPDQETIALKVGAVWAVYHTRSGAPLQRFRPGG
jgi:hypothetical protein